MATEQKRRTNQSTIMMQEEKKDEEEGKYLPQDLIAKLKETGEYQRLYDACLAQVQHPNNDDWTEGLIELGHEAVVEQQLQDGNILSLGELTETLVEAGKATISKETQDAMQVLVRASLQKVKEAEEVDRRPT